MISVLDHIEYLAAKHDCVIVPGLGAFISQYSSVKSSTGLVVALRRNIAFNTEVNYNDGLLANSIVRRENVSFEVSQSVINEYVCSLRSQLKHEGEVPVGRLGFFRYNNDDTMEFFPFVSAKSGNEYFGMTPLTIKPLSIYTGKEESTDAIQNGNSRVLPLMHRFMRAAATVALLIGLTFILSTPIVNYDKQDYADFNAFTLKKSLQQSVGDLYIAIPVEKEQPMNDIVAVETEDKTDLIKESDEQIGKYGLVVATLATQSQAEKFIKETGLSNCKIAKSSTKYRVYIAHGTFEEMCNLKSTQYAQSDAWVCRINR